MTRARRPATPSPPLRSRPRAHALTLPAATAAFTIDRARTASAARLEPSHRRLFGIPETCISRPKIHPAAAIAAETPNNRTSHTR